MSEDLKPRGDGRDWARAIVQQYNAGEKRSPAVVRLAHQALGLPLPKGLRA